MIIIIYYGVVPPSMSRRPAAGMATAVEAVRAKARGRAANPAGSMIRAVSHRSVVRRSGDRVRTWPARASGPVRGRRLARVRDQKQKPP